MTPRKINVVDSTLKEYSKSVSKTIRNELEAQLKLPSLENGLVSCQIRFYKLSAFGNDEKMIILDSSGSSWSAKLVWFSYEINYKADSVRVLVKKIINRRPYSAWSKIIASIRNLDIPNLPDSERIPNHDGSTDAGAIEIEYSHQGNYVLYHCSEPHAAERRVIQLVNLVENEFGFEGFGFK